MATAQPSLPEAQLGPAEKLLDVVLSSSAHLWHNRPGLEVGGVWRPKPKRGQEAAPKSAKEVRPGLHVSAAVRLYTRLLEIYRLNVDLFSHFASYALKETDWRDLKVACAALMLVQSRSGQPVKEDDGSVSFYDDDLRQIGEAMLLFYEKKSARMMTPKAVLRVAELLETPEIAKLNRQAGFGDPASKKPPMGRWKRVAQKWLALREANPAMLKGLVKAGFKETIKAIARKAGYKPQSQAFFEVLGWKQKQADGGHRTVGLGTLSLVKQDRFDGLSEAEICEAIDTQRLTYKDVVGRLPKDLGLTPAIMAALLPSLSDRDLRILTPTLEELGLMTDPEIRARWEKSLSTATDQRALNIAKNVRNKALREKLEEAADHAAQNAVTAATQDLDVRVMLLIDKSGSLQGAIEQSKDALSKILAGFPLEKLHIATFDTMGTVLVPKAATRAAVQHILKGVVADGGTVHGAGVRAFRQAGVVIPDTARLVVMVVGDEAGEAGDQLARAFTECGYQPSALAMLVSVASARGNTVRTCSSFMRVPFSEVDVAQFDDPYQVPRVLKTLLEAPIAAGASPRVAWVEKVMQTPLLTVA